MANKKFKIEFSKEAFNVTNETNRFDKTVYSYNYAIKELNDTLNKLDHFDDFAELKISPQSYYKFPDCKYGIEYNELIHRRADELILPHQQDSAKKFLKKLRGFGLLADVVGSGKTYEAGVILSELSIRKRIKSMLVIVPAQVYEKWVGVLENEFGVGKGVLLKVGPNLDKSKIEYNKEDNRPLFPIIVKDTDFETWKESTSDLLFDIIIVDEAHNLCNDEHSYAMKLLSLMMKKKKEAGSGSSYCLLLSATPHSGSLDKMFKLWYFIRFEGGNPKVFGSTDNNLFPDYLAAKNYYHKKICNGANTVMEYINNVKIDIINLNQKYRKMFQNFLSNPPIMNTNLFKEDIDVLKNVSYDDYLNGKPFYKLYLINLFLRDNEEIKREIEKQIASSYHNDLLGSFMIRGKKDKELARHVTNYFYYPIDKKIDKIDFYNKDGHKVIIDFDKLYTNEESINVYDSKISTKYNFNDYCNKGFVSFAKDNRIEILNNVLSYLDNNGNCKYLFKKNDYLNYYYNTFQKSVNKNIDTYVKSYEYSKGNYYHKLDDLYEILRKHNDERVIIYFDYYNKNNKHMIQDVKNILLNHIEFGSRVIKANNVDDVLKEYDNVQNAIFVCEGKEFTEGTDLQKGNVIVNFGVTPDPLSMNQRIGRIARLGQENKIHIYSLANINELEGFGLAYLSRIGIMSSNDNDATIISGSSHEKMIALRCSCCNNVRLITEEEYAHAVSTNDLAYKLKTILCTSTSKCIDPNEAKLYVDENTKYQTYATMMSRILNKDFKCDKCDTLFRRNPKLGYVCMAPTENTIMRADIQKINTLYCKKSCVVAHCQRFITGDLKDCKAVKMIRQNKNISSISLMNICSSCEIRNNCPDKCRPYNDNLQSIINCQNCIYGNKSSCNLGAHFIEFNDFSVGSCPKCRKERKNGKLVGVPTNTFNEYIRSAWTFDHNSETFIPSLESEIDRVSEIQLVLESND